MGTEGSRVDKEAVQGLLPSETGLVQALAKERSILEA